MNTSCTFPDNPFVGLRPFESDEAHLFFGRTEQTIELLQRLQKTRFLAVVGSSGCGKSSLIRAGLIPQLKAGMLVEDRDRWLVSIMKPGDRPRRNLAAALLTTFSQTNLTLDESEFDDSIRATGISAIFEQLTPALEKADANLLILADQFEEIFRFCSDKGDSERSEEAADFVSLLLALVDQSLLPIYVVLTMRSDFLGNCDAFYGLTEALNRSQYLVPRLSRKQRREAIEGPVRLYGQTIAPRLVDRILNDMGNDSDQLPVMQHTMLRVWDYWWQDRDDSIDLNHYEAKPVGTIKNALSLHAEQALEGMDDDELTLTEKIFKALTDTDTSNRRIRHAAHLKDIEQITGANPKKIMEIIERFRSGKRCFLVISAGGKPDDFMIDISHESLIRQWNKLSNWVDAEAEDHTRYKRIVDAALWKQKGGGLLQGSDLQLALDWWDKAQPSESWAKRYGGEFDNAKKFLKESTIKRRKKKLINIGITILILLCIAVVMCSTYVNHMKLQRTQMQLQMVKQNAKAKEVYNEELKKAENHRESGYIFIQQKDYKNALVSFQQATTIYKELREQGKHILTLIDIGRVKCLEKDFPQAKSVYHSARKIAREVNNREAEAQILESLASINEQEGQLLQAKRLYSESLSLYNGVGNQLACGRIYEWFAIQADGSKKFDEAEQLYKSALARYKDADPQAYERTTKALKIVSPWGFLVDLQTPHLHVLRGPKISVGRNSPEEGILNDIDFSNRYISRRHFDIQQDGTLEDLRSRNGTTINGRLLPYGVGAKLKNGDIIALANIKVLQYRTDRPLSVTSVPNGTWAVFIDGIANTYHYLTGPEYSLVFTGEKITLAPGFSNQASMKLRWNNGKAEMLKMSDDWIDQVLYKETDYVYKEYDLPEDKWLELIDVPQRCRKLKLSSKGNDIITEGPAFQVVHYADSVPNDLELAR